MSRKRWPRYCQVVGLLLVLLALLAPGLPFQPGVASARTVTWTEYNVDLTLRDDGSFRVEERQTVEFDGGPFTYAYADIPLGRVDDIRAIEVSEIRDGEIVPYAESDEESPETFLIEMNSSSITVTWFMPRTTDESRTFVLAYDVIGGMRVYESDTGTRQQIWWTAISEDVTEVAPIERGTFAIHLPEPVDLATVIIEGPGDDDPAAHSENGRDFSWDAGYMDSGSFLEARLEFPAIVNAAVPAWQAEDDARRLREQDREAREALLTILMVAAGILVGVAGAVGLLGLWYTRGRDPGVGVVADYLAEPPDDLPPGAAGALVDEEVNQRDIVATLTDLGHRGVISITEKSEGSFFKRRDFTIELKQPVDGLRPFERAFIVAILGSTEVGATVDLGDAKARFSKQVEKIQNLMYDELVQRGYFQVSPEKTRTRYKSFAMTGFVVCVIALALFGARLIGLTGWILLPFAGILIVFGSLAILSRAMPRKTYSGAETSAKWKAFRRYLTDLDRNRATQEATQLFDRYLPYAVAFGIERTWVQKFAEAGAPPPDWYADTGGGGWIQGAPGRPYQGRRTGWGGWVVMPPGGGGNAPGGDFNMPGMPDIQDMSDSAGRSLQDASGGLFELFDLAGSAFQSFGSSGSGGGGSRHGGFSGGGRSGGGGGGGSRGFG